MTLQVPGGLYADGHFDVGGEDTLYGVQATARLRGSISSGGFTAEAKIRGLGEVEGTRVDCTGTYRMHGEKR